MPSRPAIDVGVAGSASTTRHSRKATPMFDVIIAGCGPAGATLAAELRLHDVRVLVLEKETEPVSFARIVGLHIRSLELLAMRGLLERIRERGRQRPAGAYFAAIDKPAPEGLDSAHAYLLGIPQPLPVGQFDGHTVVVLLEAGHGSGCGRAISSAVTAGAARCASCSASAFRASRHGPRR